MNEKLPRLHAHFEHHRVDYSLITFNWFLVVFVDSVVSDVLFKIWDSFLYEGPKAGGAARAPFPFHSFLRSREAASGQDPAGTSLAFRPLPK